MRHSLDAFFRPRAVAVLGASATPGKLGSILMRNLLGSPFGGVVYPVNPKRHAVHGVHCYPGLAEVPGDIDLAVIATPADAVPDLVRQCSARGVRATVIASAGFSESGPAGKALERQLRDADLGRMRLLGPGSLGVLHPPTGLNASCANGMARPGHLAFFSQSGALCSAILDWARQAYVGFSTVLSVGTTVDVGFADLIDYFGDDPATRSIILYMESIGNVRTFLSAARNVARSKQIIVVKAGRHEAGARAAASHTGALAGSDAVFDAAFRRAGVLRVSTVAELFDMSEILASQAPPRGPALAVVTNAGGPGVMAVDALTLGGGQLAALAAESIAALDAVLPPFWSRANPIDLIGDATPQRYRQAVEICSRDENVEGLLVLLTPQAGSDPTETARQLLPFARLARMPVLATWMGGPDVQAGKDLLSSAGIPTFSAPEAAVQAFLHMVQYRRNQELLYETPIAAPEDWAPDAERVRRVIAAVRAAGRTLLTEVEAKDLLAAYGMDVTPTVPATTAAGAVSAAVRVGYPVALKLYSQQVTHKSDVGGVQLELADDQAVRAAFAAIGSNLARLCPGVPFEGVTVQPMLREPGFELIVGSSVDPQFGPVILFGGGGLLAEVIPDRALALPPLNRTLARRVIEQTRIYRALQGARGLPAANLDALEMLLVRFSAMLGDFPEIEEVDMNPVLAGPARVVALDARVVLCPPDLPPERRPHLAIQPYPNQYTSPFRLKDGSEAIIRAIRPEDEPLIIALHAGHSERTIRMRFFSMVKKLSHDSLIRLCHLDYDREMALVAERKNMVHRPQLLGVSRYHVMPQTDEAEFAVVVGDAWQGKGLGWHLMSRLIQVARERGVKRLVGVVLRENAPMLKLMGELGFQVRPSDDPAAVEVVLELTVSAG
jgi:acetyltransferase